MIINYTNTQYMSTNKVIIFGNSDSAELAHYYLTNDSNYEVVAFTVNQEYLTEDTFHNLPVVPFENLESIYFPSEYLFFAPMTGVKMNTGQQFPKL